MLEASTFHAIFVEVLVGSFTLSGISFLLCLVFNSNLKVLDWLDKGAHLGLFLGCLVLPLAIISGTSSGSMETSELLAKKTVYSIATLGFSIGLLVNRWKTGSNVIHSKNLLLAHSSVGILTFGLVMITGSLGGKLTRGESLLDFAGIGGVSYVAMPIWASIASILLALSIIILPKKSAV